MIEVWILLCAFVIDLIVGDPRALPHPVVGMGYVIKKLEQPLRELANRQWFQRLTDGRTSTSVAKASSGNRSLKLAGIAYPIVLVGGSFALTWLLLELLARIHPWLAYGAEVWLISTTIATKGLADAGMEIYRLLKQGDLPKARYALSMIVGRDTDKLNEGEITRGAVETVAENIVDAILSPLLYALIGGAPLAMAYRAANTLDSMVGYKNDKYLNLGWASARFDDVANWIPARLSALFIALAGVVLRRPASRSLRTVSRFARLHPSPNSGFPESAVAGALGIQLGGLNYYKGVASDRARMGDAIHPLEAEHIRLTVRLMVVSSTLFVIVLAIVAALLWS
ncbi:adenosylcobinamide-phosphate synthase CbiB [Cohnella sp. WQ 127256]|uniref:adenosylcobinamide-phosphate synthase CbiB n=1 Tax=Cohnella sp. WQ 127256 TaxID=2938790 RepID=UPI002119B40B|nr:adenosylcobinamide-phosphate synthase CbiB [Cohnella sp. WQ 127256]